MGIEHWQQLGLLTGEAAVVAALIITLYRAKRHLGLGVLFIALGTFQYLQVISALSLYVEIVPGIVISPGSVVLFSASMVAVLLVYVLEDARETRRLVYGLVYANVAMSLVSFLLGLHLSLPNTINIMNIPERFFLQDARILFVGTVALYLDVLIVVLVYEWLSRRLKSMYLRVGGALLATLTFDTVLFVTGAFLEEDNYGSLIISGIVGKSVAALAYAAVLTWFLGRAVVVDRLRPTARLPFSTLFASVAFARRHEELERQETRYDDVAEGAHVAVCELDVEAGVVHHDTRFGGLLGLESAARGTRLEDIFERIEGNARDSFFNALQQHQREPTEPMTWEFRLSDPVRPRWFLLRGSLRTVGGPMSAVLVEITHRKEMEQLTSRFLSMAGHELRTPLTSVYASLRLLASGKLGEMEPPAASVVGVAERNAERLIRIINDLLDFDRMREGGMPLRKERLSVNDVIAQAVIDLQPYADLFKVTLSPAHESSLMLNADADRLQQVLGNLLSNAVKHSPQGATVMLRASAAGSQVLFEVLDDGPDIPSELIPRLFEAFTRFGPATAGELVQSTGLGLAIARAIVLAHGGSIGFQPRDQDHDKLFYFSLPTDGALQVTAGLDP